MQPSPINPEVLRWARERSGIAREKLEKKFTGLALWETGEVCPTVKQTEDLARALHVPYGYLLFPTPPDETLPIPDYRTFSGKAVSRPSANLLDTIYACQQRQVCYGEIALASGEANLPFVGSVTLADRPETVAADMREVLGFDFASRRECPTWTDALRLLIRGADDAGILVMINGVVRSNTHRPLDLREFRGFALSDPLAPLIFVNGKDSKAAQMFTIAHELAHIWLGESGLSNISSTPNPSTARAEVWCNAVAAEFLVPLGELRQEILDDEPLRDSLSRLTSLFKVSSLVVLRRLLDVGHIEREEFESAWNHETKHAQRKSPRGGGDFYRTTLTRVGHRFARALVISTLEQKTPYTHALRMLGITKSKTFNRLCHEIGVLP